jgi:hypothetical protein
MLARWIEHRRDGWLELHSQARLESQWLCPITTSGRISRLIKDVAQRSLRLARRLCRPTSSSYPRLDGR